MSEPLEEASTQVTRRDDSGITRALNEEVNAGESERMSDYGN